MYLCLTENSIIEDENEDGRVYDFRFLTKEEHENSNKLWFEVSKILTLTGTFELSQFLREQFWDTDKYITNTLTKLFDAVHVKTPINYYLEMEQSYEKALNIFIRINSGGEKLSYSDLIMSTIISSWNTNTTSARDEFKNLIDEVWSSTEISIDKDLIIRTYLLIFSDDIKFRVTNFSEENAKEFEKQWKGIRSAIVESFELLRTFGYTERTVTSKNSILPIIHYIYISGKTKNFSKKIGNVDDRKIIKRWLHTVLLKRTFGGQSDSVLKTIRDTVKLEVLNGANNFPAIAISEKLSGTRKSLHIDSETIDSLLETNYENRYAFSILALLYPHLDYKNNDFNKDHIFPKNHFKSKELEKRGVEKSSYYTDKKIYNAIVNLQMLDSNENKSKGEKSYEEWAKTCNIDFEKQLLPKIFGMKNFPDFVEKRYDILRNKLKNELTFSSKADT